MMLSLKIKNSTSLIKKTINPKIFLRSMMSGNVYAARAAYHVMHALTTTTVNNNKSKNLIKSLVEVTMDDTKGVYQQKAALFKHILNFKVEGSVYYNYFAEYLPGTRITCVAGTTDTRVLSELPVLYEFTRHFKDNIVSVQANLDKVVGNFHAQKQTNQDFFVTIKSNNPDSFFGCDLLRPHDEKSGTGMTEHATRGTVGKLTFDKNTTLNVQTMAHAFTSEDLIDYDLKKLHLIKKGLIFDNDYSDDIHRNTFNAGKEILFSKANTLEDKILIHTQYQKFLWGNFHANPGYKRSISFIFPVVVDYNHPVEKTETFVKFKQKFTSIFGDRLYNLDKPQDVKFMTLAMLKAYKETCDPFIMDKLRNFENDIGFEFNSKFLETVAFAIKKNII